MNESPRILVMCLADPACNPRPYRAIHLFAQQGFSVDTLSFRLSKNLPVQRSYTISSPSLAFSGKLRRLSLAFFQRLLLNLGVFGNTLSLLCNDARHSLLGIRAFLPGESYDIILVEDLQLLPLAFDIRGKAKILFDAREFYSRQNEESLRFKVLEAPFRDFLLRKFASRCDSAITVSGGLRDEYQKSYAIHMEVVRSSPPLQHISVRPTSGQFRMVHHGAAHKNRGLHNMIEIVRGLDERYTLDLYLVKNSGYIDSLRHVAGDCGRIRFLPPVPFEDIIPMLCNYDIGMFYCEPTTYNLEYCLPNKFFEFIQARLALAIGPSPEMAMLVEKYQCGFVSPEFSVASMLETLRALSPDLIDAAKANSDKAAKELCYENEASKLMSIARALSQTA